MCTPVVFRVDSDDVIFAMFPTLPADIHGRYCTCYQHVGQHSSADYYGCIADSRPATPAEYADLLGELEKIGYKLKIVKRASWKMHNIRYSALREVK